MVGPVVQKAERVYSARTKSGKPVGNVTRGTTNPNPDAAPGPLA
ncbi:hypothetical protein AHiyo6_19450, partial [Arthrobacter sp. Hiyo6]